MNKKFLTSTTDWILVGVALLLFGTEMLGMLGVTPLITTETVEMSIYQVWIPFVLGSLMGHFFPLPWRVEGQMIPYLIWMFGFIVFYVFVYIYIKPEYLFPVVDFLADYLYAFFLGGYVLGSTFFSRPTHRLED